MKGDNMPVMASAPKSRKNTRKLREVTIEPADNGGFVVSERYSNSDGPYEEPKKAAFADGSEALAHAAQCLGIKSDSDGDEDAAD